MTDEEIKALTHPISCQCLAQKIADHMLISYYMQDRDEHATKYHMKQAHAEFAELAEKMGYRISKIQKEPDMDEIYRQARGEA